RPGIGRLGTAPDDSRAYRSRSRAVAVVAGDEALAQGVLAHRPGLEELHEVVGTARLGPHARQPIAPERVPADDGAGDRAVDVDVPRPQLGLGQADVGR